MFIRKRVRDKAIGARVHFTALRSVRTPAGPRQQTVVSWTSHPDPTHPLYAPSVETALAQVEVGVEPWIGGIERWRDLARHHREVADNAHPRRAAKAHKYACRIEAILQDKEQQAEGLRTVLAELGNWTWDGQL